MIKSTMQGLLLAVTCWISASNPARADQPALLTLAEQTGFHQTGRYQEVIDLCHAFQSAYPDEVRCVQFGTTPEGRPMMALIATATGINSGEQARASGLPVLLIQGGIHAGEIDGKDAGFMVLRQLLRSQVAPGALKKMVLIFVPVFNVDGHERFGAWNRPNQVGPDQMGWRVTAQNLNLNRDYVKADAPEMQAMLNLVNQWDPLVYVDLHVTDGAKFQHDISIQVEPLISGDPQLRGAGRQLRDNVISELNAQGAKALNYYPEFIRSDDPESGFEDGVSPGRFSNGYFVLRNRYGMLVETHSWKDYPTRVRLTHNTLVSVIGQLAGHGQDWLRIAHQADQINLAGQSVPLSFRATDAFRIVQFQGYRYTREKSEVSGALMVHYDDSQPQIWEVPLHDQVIPDLVVTAPQAGYLVPAGYAAQVGARLALHGISYRILDRTIANAAVEAFRAEQVSFAPRSFEGHQLLQLGGDWHPEQRDVPAGSLFVPIAQPKARLLMTMLEPRAPDSLAMWGEFNNAFERKEYMENYVTEQVAREQLAADPELAQTFRHKLDNDPKFAADPEARLEFFARRHPSWDERFNLYPVLRTAHTPE